MIVQKFQRNQLLLKRLQRKQLSKNNERIEKVLQYWIVQFLICRKHSRVQKAVHKVTTNCFVCMNRYCQQSFLPLCSQCKPDHRDHSNKILTLQDISFLIERLLKTPFKELSGYIQQAVTAMKKFKLVQENRRKIQQLEREIEREVVGLVEWTEHLVHEYAKCKKKVSELADLLVDVEIPSTFNSFANRSHQLLSNLEYNYQKDKFQYGNASIRQKFQSRRKSYERTRRKLEQVKDYSMKIIQVILANEDDDSEGEGDIVYKKKIYQILKKQIYQLYPQNLNQKSQLKTTNNHQEKHMQKVSNIEKEAELHIGGKNLSFLLPQQSILNLDTNSKCSSPTIAVNLSSSPTSSPISLTKYQSPPTTKILSVERSSQTCSQWLKSIQQGKRESELKIKRTEQANAKQINELQNNISMLVRQKQTANKQCLLIEEKNKLRTQHIAQIENKLRVNRSKRGEIQKQRQSKLQALIQISNWRTILEGDTIH